MCGTLERVLVRPPLPEDAERWREYGWRAEPDVAAAAAEHEPRVTEELLALENVALTPHIASATRETRHAMGMLVVSALRAVLLEDRVPENAV